MKRYLILILLVMLVFVSGVAVGCGQKQQEIKESLDYLDKVNSLGIRYLKAINTVLDADITFSEVMDFRDESRLLETSALVKHTTSQALDLVNSELSSLENVVPPREAQKLHTTVIKSLRTAQTGLEKWSHASAVNYDRTYALLHPSVPKKVYPSSAEEISQARQLIHEAVDAMRQANTEMDILFNVIEQKAKK